MESEATRIKKYIRRQKNIRTVSPKLRHMIFDRDKHTCQYCGIKADPKHYNYGTYRGVDYIRYEGGVVLEVDHIIPWSQGGRTEPKNLITGCWRCNQQKRTKSAEDWRKRVNMSKCVKPEPVVVQ
jgi:5-methylcytosine-specific restriction endonuclease McrA